MVPPCSSCVSSLQTSTQHRCLTCKLAFCDSTKQSQELLTILYLRNNINYRSGLALNFLNCRLDVGTKCWWVLLFCLLFLSIAPLCQLSLLQTQRLRQLTRLYDTRHDTPGSLQQGAETHLYSVQTLLHTGRGHTRTHAHRHTDTQTHRHTDTQTDTASHW